MHFAFKLIIKKGYLTSLELVIPHSVKQCPIFYSFLQFINMKIHIFWDVTHVLDKQLTMS